MNNKAIAGILAVVLGSFLVAGCIGDDTGIIPSEELPSIYLDGDWTIDTVTTTTDNGSVTIIPGADDTWTIAFDDDGTGALNYNGTTYPFEYVAEDLDENGTFLNSTGTMDITNSNVTKTFDYTVSLEDGEWTLELEGIIAGIDIAIVSTLEE